MYGRPIQINQNAYKDYRVNPVEFPFREIAIDHIGPFLVKNDNQENSKIYILIVTCMWSRAINLIVCRNINNESFLQAIQLHVFEHGIPQRILSDNGSPIVSSLKQITKFLDDSQVKNFLIERNIEVLDFCPYPANASYLGGIVESLVKQVKNAIYSSISKNILSYDHFHFLVQECKMLINKRPIAYQSALIDRKIDCDRFALTPEMIIKGYEIPSISIIPALHSEEDLPNDTPWEPEESAVNKILFKNFKKLNKVKAKLHKFYFDDFLQNLRNLASNKPNSYRTKKHSLVEISDLVAVKQPFSKPYFYPLGLVTKVELNDLEEVVAITLRKSNGEEIRRHITDIILLEKNIPEVNIDLSGKENKPTNSFFPQKKATRKAAESCVTRNRILADKNLT
jgi:hypothetical protein